MRKELKQIASIVELIGQINGILRQQNPMEEQMKEDMLAGIAETNMQVFGCAELPVASMDLEETDSSKFCSQADQWLSLMRMELDTRKTLTTKVDYDFHVFIQHVKMVSEEVLIAEGVKHLLDIRQASETMYQQIIAFHNRFSDFWGEIDLDKGKLDLLSDRAKQLKHHTEDFIWLYHELADYRSKKVLYGILHFWLTFDYDEKRLIKENNYDDYFDYDLFVCDSEEVFVDVGAFNGDSAKSFIDNYGSYKRIYCYEITETSCEKLQNTLAEYDDIVYRNVGVGDKNEMLHMQMAGTGDSCNRVSETEGTPVEIVRLDDDITEPVTFIKMDIEGSELAALEGAKGHIRKDKPKLAICTYHNNHHIWEIPRKIKEYNPDYKLFMRYNGSWDGIVVSEFVTFAVDNVPPMKAAE